MNQYILWLPEEKDIWRTLLKLGLNFMVHWGSHDSYWIYDSEIHYFTYHRALERSNQCNYCNIHKIHWKDKHTSSSRPTSQALRMVLHSFASFGQATSLSCLTPDSWNNHSIWTPVTGRDYQIARKRFKADLKTMVKKCNHPTDYWEPLLMTA